MGCSICGCQQTRWLRVGGIALQFSCSTRRVRRLIHKGEIEACRFGREWLVDHASLDRYVTEHRVRPGEFDRAGA